MAYKTFKRSARNWDEFVTATKYADRSGLTREEARERCHDFNDNRTDAQIAAGTKMEFDGEGE
jgi:hypothetical protein